MNVSPSFKQANIFKYFRISQYNSWLINKRKRIVLTKVSFELLFINPHVDILYNFSSTILEHVTHQTWHIMWLRIQINAWTLWLIPSIAVFPSCEYPMCMLWGITSLFMFYPSLDIWPYIYQTELTMTQEQKKERNNQSKQHIDYLRLERKRKGTESGTSISRFLFRRVRKRQNDKMLI